MMIPAPALTPEQEEAALQTSEGRSAQKIADQLKVTRKTIERWRQLPPFVARVREHQEELFRSIRAKGVAVIELRVRARQRRLNALYSICKKRAANPKRGNAEWDDTGLVVRRDKMLGSGETAMLTTEFELDAAMLKAMYDLEEGIATDMGQRRHRIDVNVPDKPPMLPAAIEIAKQLTPDELNEKLRKLDDVIAELTRQPQIINGQVEP